MRTLLEICENPPKRKHFCEEGNNPETFFYVTDYPAMAQEIKAAVAAKMLVREPDEIHSPAGSEGHNKPANILKLRSWNACVNAQKQALEGMK